MKGRLKGLNSQTKDFLNFSILKQLLEHYSEVLNINEISLQSEILKYHAFTEVDSDLKNMNPEFYPNVMKLINLKNSLPVSTASVERTFSCMNRIKTFKRGKLSDCLLSDILQS